MNETATLEQETTEAPPVDMRLQCQLHPGEWYPEYVSFPAGAAPMKGECSLCATVRLHHATVDAQARDQSHRLKAQHDTRQKKLDESIERAGIPLRYREYRLDTFPKIEAPYDEDAELVLSACKTYANQWPSTRKTGANLILIGNNGAGKTGIACSIATQVMRDHGATAMFMSAYGAVRHQRDTWGKKGKREAEALADLVNPDLLILDEVGVQVGSDGEMLLLTEVLNSRYAERKPTIVLSNLTMEDYVRDATTVTQPIKRPGLRTYLGSRIIDRLLEGDSQLVSFRWKSLRRGAV